MFSLVSNSEGFCQAKEVGPISREFNQEQMKQPVLEKGRKQKLSSSKLFKKREAFAKDIYISLLIISCIIEYVTNKRTLNLEIFRRSNSKKMESRKRATR